MNSISPRVSRKKQVTLVSSPDKNTQHHNICNLFITDLPVVCRNGAGWWVCPGQLWVLDSKAEVTVEAETPAFKQSTQHYFFKKQPLPVVESVEEEDDPGVAVENAPSSSEDEENTVEESDEKAGLRERVKNALNELER